MSRTSSHLASQLSETLSVPAAVSILCSETSSELQLRAAGMHMVSAASKLGDQVKAVRSQLSTATSLLSAPASASLAASPASAYRHPGMSAELSAKVDAELAESEAWAADLESMFGDEIPGSDSPEARVESARAAVLRREQEGPFRDPSGVEPGQAL